MSPTLLAAAVLLSPAAPALKESPKPPALVGRWECTALTVSGKADPQWKGLEYEFTADGTWVIYRDGKVIDQTGRTYKHDPTAGPAAVDVCERADGTAEPGIYRLDGDVLRLALRVSEARRPTSFDPGEGLMTFEFRRVKPKE
jgi:uncharacterized protein (TIGR03067 family)